MNFIWLQNRKVMSKIKIVPIFPLDLVLFPNQDLSLRIFEPRYKQMIDDCIISNKEFGICLAHPDITITNWQAPYNVGTIAKIIDCNDVDVTSGHLAVNIKGHSRFRIIRIISPCLEKPVDYDPYSVEGLKQIDNLHESAGMAEKMYIQAEIELIDDIDQQITLEVWQNLVELWKKKISIMAIPQVISSQQLELMLEQYYLKTEIPTLEYVYSLCALGASHPDELQSILESTVLDQLIERCQKVLKL